MNLVEGGDAVQEPDIVRGFVVFEIGEMRIGGGVVEIDIGLRIPRGQHGILKG